MIVDVTWDGVALARGAQAREEDGGWFVELEHPMPVGTVLVLDGEAQATVRVARVSEGAGAGMLLRRVDSRPSTVDGPKSEAEPEVKAEAAKGEAEPAKGEAEPEPEERGGNGKKDRRRRRKTFIGH